MNNDIEDIVNDNLSIKRAYLHCKNNNQRLQKDNKDKQQIIIQLEQKNQDIQQKYSELTRKYKKLQGQLQSNSLAFSSQIQELKMFIEQKEQDLENFQLRMIPSLDQDMLRVKLISQMQGPYQQVVDKKDKQISKLKDQIHRIKRDKQILQFSNANIERTLKQQMLQNKQFYEKQNERLTKQLTHVTCKKNTKTYQNSIISGYRRQIQQLKIAMEYQKSNEQSLRKQISELKTQKQQLLTDLSKINIQKAYQMSKSPNQQHINTLKHQRNKLQDQKNALQRQLDKLKRNIHTSEQDKTRTIKSLQKQHYEHKRQCQSQRQKLKEKIMDLNQQVYRLKNVKNRQQQDYMILSNKYNSINTSYEQLKEDYRKIKIEYSNSYNNSRHNHSSENTHRTVQKQTRIQIQKQVRVQVYKELRTEIQKQLRVKIQKQIRQQLERQYSHHSSPNKQNDNNNNLSGTIKSTEKIKQLEIKIVKLNKKLQFANRKIMELLQEKVKWKRQGRNEENVQQGDYYEWGNTDEYRRQIIMEHRDCSFVPMVPPVIIRPERNSYL